MQQVHPCCKRCEWDSQQHILSIYLSFQFLALGSNFSLYIATHTYARSHKYPLHHSTLGHLNNRWVTTTLKHWLRYIPFDVKIIYRTARRGITWATIYLCVYVLCRNRCDRPTGDRGQRGGVDGDGNSLEISEQRLRSHHITYYTLHIYAMALCFVCAWAACVWVRLIDTGLSFYKRHSSSSFRPVWGMRWNTM